MLRPVLKKAGFFYIFISMNGKKRTIKTIAFLLVFILAAYGIAYVADTIKAKKDTNVPPSQDEQVPPSDGKEDEDKNDVAEAEGKKITDFAMQYTGTKYSMGGSSPETGFDCSGFVFYVLNSTGHTIKARTALDQYKASEKIDAGQLLPGDLVFFSGTYGTSEVSHVGIYLGDGSMIHSGDESTGVHVSNITDGYWASHLYGYGRLK